MKINSLEILGIFSAVLILFFIDQITFLVESIYMLNLLNTQLDIRALGILFLMLPVFIFFLKPSKMMYKILVFGMLICMLLSPLLPSTQRIFSSGIGAGSFLLYFGIYISDKNAMRVNWGESAALATLLSILLRVFGNTLNVSLTGPTVFISWILVLMIGFMFFSIIRKTLSQNKTTNIEKNTQVKDTSLSEDFLNTLGIFGSLIFIYFVFSSPGVLARWTEGKYGWINILLSVSILVIVFYIKPKIISVHNFRWILLVWNIIFLVLFLGNILQHRIIFPTIDNISPVVDEGSKAIDSILTFTMILFSPVIFINISWFSSRLRGIKPHKIAWSFIGGILLVIICTFMFIFTNTWGYVGTLSQIFRNQFHIPFLIAGIAMVLPLMNKSDGRNQQEIQNYPSHWTKGIAAIFVVGICGFFLLNQHTGVNLSDKKQRELTLMTYNIQQGVDYYGNKNFEGQLARIEEINPDILCLQESDAARISGGNSDVVRYFASKLRYYSYYGPKTTTGTYGTAILSKYPLENCHSVFTYSSKDEIGTTFADMTVGDREITVVNSHPAGDHTSREEHIKTLLFQIKDKAYVIAMGDYNFRQDSPYYQMITDQLIDSWLFMYPDAIGDMDEAKVDLTFKGRKTSSGELLANGKIDMKNRIDHIFLSESFKVKEAHYLPAPESETDHPLYWAVVEF